jgi:hypothetical protein
MDRRRQFPATLFTALVLTVTVSAWPGAKALAQHTADPYNIVGEYNSQFEPYLYAVQPNDGGFFPNQGRLMQDRSAFRGANRFQSYIDSLDGAGSGLDSGTDFRRGGAGMPYSSAHRRYAENLGQVYRPNEAADRMFFSQQQERNQAYFDAIRQRNQKYSEAMRETDPKKRAQLLREYNLETLRVSRSLSPSRSAAALDRTAPPPPSTSTAPDSTLSTGPRRSTEPPAARPSTPSSLPPATRARPGFSTDLTLPRSSSSRLRGLGSTPGFGTGTNALGTSATGRIPGSPLERDFDRFNRTPTYPPSSRRPTTPDAPEPPPR